jgi:hypothetical protein
MTPSNHDKFHEFKTLFAFYKIQKSFGHMFVVLFAEQDAPTSFSFHG